MCGIGGILGPGASEGAVRTMLRLMAHRGPDGEGLWSQPGITLGHRRLAIVDLSDRGAQPMISADGLIIIVVNGEIYNYPELRAELEREGCVFQSDSDSEVVIHAWRKWGERSFAKYNGMFAFALHDREAERTYLVRDPLGIKPLYYWDNAGTISFASDLRAIVGASGRKEWPISARGLDQYLSFENRFGCTTMLEGIHLLTPGAFLKIDGPCHSLEQFANPLDVRTGEAGFEEATARFRTAFEQAVERHLMSDVPLASYLSAGIDSGMVTLTAARLLNGAGPATFTGTFDAGGWYDEATGAQAVAEKAGLTSTRVAIDASAFAHHFDDVVYALEEPRMGTGALPQYMVAKAVAVSHKVVLTGHGGDELFSGYPVFKFVLLRHLIRTSFSQFLSALRSVRLSEWPHIVYFAWMGMRSGREKTFLPELFNRGLKERLLTKRLASRLAALTTTKSTHATDFSELMTEYLRDYLPGLLIVEDKLSMAHAIESRTPYLDNELVSFALSLPQEVKLEKGVLKAIPKAAARGILPDIIFSLPKRGFPNPLGRWLRGPLAAWTRERICTPGNALAILFETDSTKLFVERYLRSPWRQFRPLDEIDTHRIWMLLCLESWIRQFKQHLDIDLQPPSSSEAA